MFPFIMDGDILTISPYLDTKLERGDIVAFLESTTQQLVIHRIIHISGNHFISQGDCCLYRDQIQPTHNIIGFVSGVNEKTFNPDSYTDQKIKLIISFLSQIKATAYIGKILQKITTIRNYGMLVALFNKTKTEF